MGKEIRHDGREHRLQREDQPHMAGGGVLLLHRLDDEAHAGAEHPQKQGRSPHGRGLWQAGLLQQEGQPQHHEAHHPQLQNAQLQGVDLRIVDRPVRQHQIPGVGYGA